MERARLLPSYGQADFDEAKARALAHRVVYVIAGTIAIAATTAVAAAGLHDPLDAAATQPSSAAAATSQLVAWNEYSPFESGKPVPYTITWCVRCLSRALARGATRARPCPVVGVVRLNGLQHRLLLLHRRRRRALAPPSLRLYTTSMN